MIELFFIMPHELENIAGELRSDGALRDFYICAANEADWNAVLNRVRSNWAVHRFTVDGECRELPLSFAMIQHLRTQANPCLNIQLAGALVNCHFFGEAKIEFDFRPEDFRTPERWSALCAFFQDMVDAVGKSGIITHENSQDAVIDRFIPVTVPFSNRPPLPPHQ